jgi:hypothetical protein
MMDADQMIRDQWWPFGDDADREDPLTELRIAVTSAYPGWAFLVAFDRESEARPTDLEAAQLRSYLDEYIFHWYTPSYRAELSRRALDVDGGAIGVVLHKWGEDDWGYRRQSYTLGHRFTVNPPGLRGGPFDDGMPGPLSLERLMDRMHAFGSHDVSERWRQWKSNHPDVFPSVAAPEG